MLSYLTCLDHQELRKYLCELLPSPRGSCRMSHRWHQGALNNPGFGGERPFSGTRMCNAVGFHRPGPRCSKNYVFWQSLVNMQPPPLSPQVQSTQWWPSHKWLESDSIEASTCFRQGRQFPEIRAGGILFPYFPSLCVVMRNALTGQKPQRSASHRGWSDWCCLPQFSERMGGEKAGTGHRRD